jgi:hypothetical protein
LVLARFVTQEALPLKKRLFFLDAITSLAAAGAGASTGRKKAGTAIRCACGPDTGRHKMYTSFFLSGMFSCFLAAVARRRTQAENTSFPPSALKFLRRQSPTKSYAFGVER